MKLHYSPESQYVRKVMACAIEMGIVDKLELLKNKEDLEKHNPLLKRPVLITDDGDPICDSPVICAYLDSVAGGGKVIPKSGRERWRALSEEGIADGAMESVTAIRHDRQYHEGQESQPIYDRHILKINQTLDACEEKAAAGEFKDRVDIGTLTIAVMCAYFDFRLPDLGWRSTRPTLADWYEDFSKRPSIEKTRTRPRDE